MRLGEAIERLAAADQKLEELVGEPRSLNPTRARATPLRELGEELLADVAPEVVAAFAEGLSCIVEASAENFPETLFWDADYMAAALLRGPAGSDASQLRALCADIAGLQAQYGRNSVLAFRYTHDFTYGYDWAKWVRKDADVRRSVGPFDPDFIGYLRRRGSELVELIANDDEKYPKLPNGRPRNPFGFSREPEHERLLLTTLAATDDLPLRTWETDATPRADRPFAEVREACARELGVPVRSGDG